MKQLKDIAGQKYGRLTAIRRYGKNAQKETTWLCMCDCGNEHVVSLHKLTAGTTKSCGCLRIDGFYGGHVKHGQKNTKLYGVWRGMKIRCNNKNNPFYHRYGGRGIRVCEEWMNFEPFYKWATENGHEQGLMIDRTNNDGNYEPDNCRWVTPIVQANNKGNNITIEINGELKTIAEWARHYGVSYNQFYKQHRHPPAYAY